ncbi:MAG: peptidase MA family metallohydrolase [Candidatus Omnitrophota bacterium]|nr:peptidase MA family metallohydrolase [Candidatus Omnitrophota bacterium]
MNLAPLFLAFFVSLASCGLADDVPFGILKGHANTMNFSVWAPAQKDAETVAASLEEYYRRFLKDLDCGSMLKKKPQVYIFASYQDYLDNLSRLGYNVANTGGIATRRSARKPAEIYSFLSNNLLDEVLPHEITHLLFKEIVAGLKVDANVPLWLNEGMATYEETSDHYTAQVKEALAKGVLMPAAEIVKYSSYPADLGTNSLFYAESASLVDFLLSEYGGAKFTSFSRKMVSGGKNINEALYSTYYPRLKDVSQLNDAWLKFLKK